MLTLRKHPGDEATSREVIAARGSDHDHVELGLAVIAAVTLVDTNGLQDVISRQPADQSISSDKNEHIQQDEGYDHHRWVYPVCLLRCR